MIMPTLSSYFFPPRATKFMLHNLCILLQAEWENQEKFSINVYSYSFIHAHSEFNVSRQHQIVICKVVSCWPHCTISVFSLEHDFSLSYKVYSEKRGKLNFSGL